ncbi:MAG TPA: hypothetical protein PKB10_11330 [Tepidisphaeraceae bacterium]|nr:hypothetical protein [Tepidisphaeraceae bacterium]
MAEKQIEDTGTFVGDRPASGGVRKVLQNPHTAHRVRDLLKTLLWVGPMTLLIWVYAEREQLSRDTITVVVNLRSAEPDRVITPSRQTVALDLRGPRAQLDAIRRNVASGNSDAEINLTIQRTPGIHHELSYASLLSENNVFRGAGIDILKTDPAFGRIFVDEVIEAEVPVTEPQLDARFDGPIVFEPRTVRARGPRSQLEHRLNSGQPLAVAEMAQLPQLQQPGSHNNIVVSLRSPGESITLVPATVAVDFRIVEQRTRTYRIPSVIIEVRKPAALEGRVNVEVNPPVLTNVDVLGPVAVIDEMERNARSAAPVAVLRITAEDVTARRGTKPVRFDLPTGVMVVGEARTAEFTITDAPSGN